MDCKLLPSNAFPKQNLRKRSILSFLLVRHYALKLRLFTNFELLFSFLVFILTLLFDLRELGSRDLSVQVPYYHILSSLSNCFLVNI